MAENSAEVLQEFLVSLGWKIDEVGQKNFEGVLGKVLKSTAGVTKGVVGVAAAAEAMVSAVTYEFERLYYAAIRVGDTMSHVQGAIFGAGKVGIAGDQMEHTLENMAQLIRRNPGLSQMFQVLTGDKPSGTVKSMLDLVEKMQQRYGGPGSKNYFMGALYAEQLGIPENVYNMLTQPGAIPSMRRSIAEREGLNTSLGIDTKEFAERSREFNNNMRDLAANFGALAQVIGIGLMDSINGLNSLIMDVVRHFTGTDKNPVQVDAKGIPLTREHSNYVEGRIRGAAPGAATDLKTLADQAAKANGIPPDLFRAMIGVESGWNANARGSAGEYGLTQLMPATVKALGINNPLDPKENLYGGAKWLAKDFEKYGNWKDALAAYNAGTPNSAAGQKYAINVTNHITTQDNPIAIASGVARATELSVASAMRNSQGTLNAGGKVAAQ